MIGIYPGSFDPITNGHLDIIERASRLLDKLYISVLNNASKVSSFEISEKIELIKLSTNHISNIQITSYNGLLIDYATKINADVIIRGLRAVTDFEYEFQLALTNRKLNTKIETLFISASTDYLFLSSSVIKDIAKNNGNIEGMVPNQIIQKINDKFKTK